MEKLILSGGNPLFGSTAISGAKNSALPLMAASLLAKGIHQLSNIPKLRDVETLQKLLSHLGVESKWEGDILTLTGDVLKSNEAPYDLVKTMRASVLCLGPLLSRLGEARVSLPGGCAIGARPIDLHLEALKQMGAEIEIKEGYVIVKAKKLHGADITFTTVTVTGTENILMAATMAEGETILRNAAQEPEVTDLADYLKKMGAKIEGVGTDILRIQGVKNLNAGHHRVIADRIEAGTFLMAGAITSGEVTIENCPPEFLTPLLSHLEKATCRIEIKNGDGKSQITLCAPKKLKSVSLTTAPFPGFATDFQAQFMALMALAEGTSTLTETIFENRFQHALELKRLGANIEIQGHTARIHGVPKLYGAPLMATDLRASASLILAGLAAEGETLIDRAYHIDRGYENIEVKLSKLGAKITRSH